MSNYYKIGTKAIRKEEIADIDAPTGKVIITQKGRESVEYAKESDRYEDAKAIHTDIMNEIERGIPKGYCGKNGVVGSIGCDDGKNPIKCIECDENVVIN